MPICDSIRLDILSVTTEDGKNHQFDVCFTNISNEPIFLQKATYRYCYGKNQVSSVQELELKSYLQKCEHKKDKISFTEKAERIEFLMINDEPFNATIQAATRPVGLFKSLRTRLLGTKFTVYTP